LNVTALDPSHRKTGTDPLVSIVVPSYNHASYLRQAIESVLNQSYSHFELIVIDDGSTDNSLQILEEFEGRVTWQSQANMGQARTLNKGWEQAKGEVLSYLSADDRLLPDAIGTAVAYLQDLSDIVMVYGDYNLIDSHSKILRRVHAPAFSYFDMVVRTVCAPGPGVFFRRAAHRAAGGWNPELRQWPDYDYWLRLGLQGSFFRIPHVLAEFRVHHGSQTFGPVLFDRAEEPVRILTRFYNSGSTLPNDVTSARGQALANAEIASAQLHFRAGRVRAAIRHIAAALSHDAISLLRLRTWYIVLHGILGRVAWTLWIRLRSRAH